MEFFKFDKSLQERLTEFTNILSSREITVPASQIQSEWSYYVELVIEPVGWKALWKIPRLICQEFGIHYPTIVLVIVEEIFFHDLSALVKITAVQDDIHLPEKYDVPLIELYPLINQENNVLDMESTANCIDQLRFFYNHLWMPWDIDDDENKDWVIQHLEPRIRLYFDMNRNIVNKHTCDVIRTLMREGREIQEKISRLEDSLSDNEEIQETAVNERKTCQLMKLHFRLQQIKTEMEVLENPAMRDMLDRNHHLSSDSETKKLQVNQNKCMSYLIWLGGPLDILTEVVGTLRKEYPMDLAIQSSSSLHEALYIAETGDIIFLSEGEHCLRGTGGIEEGGIIRGIQKMENTVILPKEMESRPSLFDFSGNKVKLENLSINLGELQAGIIVRKGTVEISNCKIYVATKTSVKLGIIVLPGASLIVKNTLFESMGTAVVIYATGTATLEGSNFINCIEGIQLQDNANFIAKNCKLSYFKEYAIRMETTKYLTESESKSGNLDLLSNVTEISLNDCTFDNNEKGDVCLKHNIAIAFTTKSNNMEIDS